MPGSGRQVMLHSKGITSRLNRDWQTRLDKEPMKKASERSRNGRRRSRADGEKDT